MMDDIVTVEAVGITVSTIDATFKYYNTQVDK